MSTTLAVILLAVGIVAFFALAMSLTMIFKGHHIKSEIGENENMRARGIKCVVQEAREQEGHGGDDCSVSASCNDHNCPTCFGHSDTRK